MRRYRLHRKVFLVWGRYWAAQLVLGEIGGFGLRPKLLPPCLDIYLGPVTLAFGRNAHLTQQHERLRGCCRGFLVGDFPIEAVL